jgi:hypothetical protein
MMPQFTLLIVWENYGFLPLGLSGLPGFSGFTGRSGRLLSRSTACAFMAGNFAAALR